MNTFEVNGKKYTAKEFDLNLVCDLEDFGISLEEVNKKSMSTIRAYFALCAGLDKDDAGKEIQQHLISGGKFNGIVEVMSKAMENSDFFCALKEKSETENTESETETTAQTA